MRTPHRVRSVMSPVILRVYVLLIVCGAVRLGYGFEWEYGDDNYMSGGGDLDSGGYLDTGARDWDSGGGWDDWDDWDGQSGGVDGGGGDGGGGDGGGGDGGGGGGGGDGGGGDEAFDDGFYPGDDDLFEWHDFRQPGLQCGERCEGPELDVCPGIPGVYRECTRNKTIVPQPPLGGWPQIIGIAPLCKGRQITVKGAFCDGNNHGLATHLRFIRFSGQNLPAMELILTPQGEIKARYPFVHGDLVLKDRMDWSDGYEMVFVITAGDVGVTVQMHSRKPPVFVGTHELHRGIPLESINRIEAHTCRNVQQVHLSTAFCELGRPSTSTPSRSMSTPRRRSTPRWGWTPTATMTSSTTTAMPSTTTATLSTTSTTTSIALTTPRVKMRMRTTTSTATVLTSFPTTTRPPPTTMKATTPSPSRTTTRRKTTPSPLGPKSTPTTSKPATTAAPAPPAPTTTSTPATTAAAAPPTPPPTTTSKATVSPIPPPPPTTTTTSPSSKPTPSALPTPHTKLPPPTPTKTPPITAPPIPPHTDHAVSVRRTSGVSVTQPAKQTPVPDQPKCPRTEHIHIPTAELQPCMDIGSFCDGLNITVSGSYCETETESETKLTLETDDGTLTVSYPINDDLGNDFSIDFVIGYGADDVAKVKIYQSRRCMRVVLLESGTSLVETRHVCVRGCGDMRGIQLAPVLVDDSTDDDCIQVPILTLPLSALFGGGGGDDVSDDPAHPPTNTLTSAHAQQLVARLGLVCSLLLLN